MRNVLQIAKLSRNFLRTTLTCQATNTPLSHPLTKSVQIELNRKSNHSPLLFLFFAFATRAPGHVVSWPYRFTRLAFPRFLYGEYCSTSLSSRFLLARVFHLDTSKRPGSSASVAKLFSRSFRFTRISTILFLSESQKVSRDVRNIQLGNSVSSEKKKRDLCDAAHGKFTARLISRQQTRLLKKIGFVPVRCDKSDKSMRWPISVGC